MLNKYKWSWNMVLKFDPSYKKYLTRDTYLCELSEDEKEEWIEEEDIVENEEVYDRYRLYGIDKEEDIDIIKEMSSTEAKSTEVKEASRLVHNVAQVNCNWLLNAKYEKCKHTADPLMKLLSPPKSVLAEGSSMYLDSYLNYEVCYEKEDNTDIVKLVKNRLFTSDGKVGILSWHYRFDRFHNCVTELKMRSSMVIYNLKTFKLYKITHRKNNNKKRSHINRYISQLGLNRSHYNLRNFSERIVEKFIDTIIENTLKYMDFYIPRVSLLPNAYSPSYEGYYMLTKENWKVTQKEPLAIKKSYLYPAVIQSRVGHPMEWVADTNVTHNISEIVSIPDYYAKITNTENHEVIPPEELKRRERNLRARTIYKIIPALKQNPSLSTVYKTMFGKYYKNIYPNILNKIGVNSLLDIIKLDNSGLLTKNIYHHIVRYIRDGKTTNCRRIGELISYMISQRDDINSNTIDTYLKLLDRLGSIPWSLFRDTVNMAKELSVRLRPNTFNNIGDLRAIHDRLAGYYNRDSYNIDKYKDRAFIKFESPDKLYGGFEFVQLTSAEDLVEEGKNMRHCVGSYSYYCISGTSIIYSMRKNGKGYVTIELSGDSEYYIRQKYTINDNIVNNENILKLISNWRDDLLKIHKNDTITYEGLCKLDNEKYELIKDKENLEHLLTNSDLSINKDVVYSKIDKIVKQIESMEDNTWQNQISQSEEEETINLNTVEGVPLGAIAF